MPYFYMPTDNAMQVKEFFKGLVDDGKLRIIDATQGTDALESLHPCDDIRLILGTEPTCPIADLDIAKTLDAFAPEPDAGAQFTNWTNVLESDAGPSPVAPSEVPPADTGQSMGEDVDQSSGQAMDAAADGQPLTSEKAALDEPLLLKPRTPYSSRGYKG